MKGILRLMNWIEVFGFTFSLIIVSSFLFTDKKKIRVCNMVGACGFACYGIIIHAFPVVTVEIIAVCINSAQIWREYAKNKRNI